MKYQKKTFIEITILAFSIFLSAFLWKFISIPYVDTDIVGEYAKNNFNPKNDIIRYLSFITLPVTIFFLLKLSVNKKNIYFLLSNIYETNIQLKKKSYLIFIFLVIFIFFVFELFSLDFSPTITDDFHEGQKLSAAFKSHLDGTLWSGSYMTVGVFHEILSSKLSWNIFDNVSIGSGRLLEFILILVFKLLIVTFLYNFIRATDLNNFYCFSFLILTSFFSTKLIDYNSGTADLLSYRDMPSIILMICLPYLISEKKISYLYLIILSFLIFPSLFWSLDRGIFYILTIMFINLIFIFKKNYFKILISIISIILSYYFFSSLLPTEFDFFVKNSFEILQEINFIHGIIHPIPFTSDDNSSRVTKNLLFIIFNILISLNIFFKKKNKYNNIKLYFLLLAFIGFISYFNAIGRSDGPHIKSSFGIPLVASTIFFLFNIFYYLQNNTLINKYASKLVFISSIFCIIYLFLNINYSNLSNSSRSIKNYISLSDDKFLKKEQSLFVSYAKNLLFDTNCVQLFTNDAILNYLLKKPSCTKYYFVWSVGSNKLQNDFIQKLKKTKYIITDDLIQNPYYPQIKLPLVNKYINENYTVLSKSYKYKIMIRN